MHYVSAVGLTKSFGVTPLFENISFHIEEGDKIALVARNGTGKSTLLKILAGTETPDEGKCRINKDVDVVLLEQEPVFKEEFSILDNIFFHDHPVLNAIKEFEAISTGSESGTSTGSESGTSTGSESGTSTGSESGTSTGSESGTSTGSEPGTIQDREVKLNAAIHKMDDLGAWEFEAKVKQVLGKLNIQNLSQVVKTLSGGQRKRVALAKTLIDIGFDHKHVLVIMDEPTNHLDVEMVEWLERYLDKENVTLLLVTHDRYFLDTVCTEIWELSTESSGSTGSSGDSSNMYVYKGNYENYLEKKAARMDSELSSIDKAKNLYRKELEWMRKQPKARTTKSKSRQDNYYVIEKKAKQKIEDQQVELQTKMSRLGGKVIELKKVYKSYGDKIILKGFDYNFKKGERIGVVGKNGVGKTTFTNILQGIEKADSGKVNVGDTVVFGNYSQEGLVVKEDIRVIEFVKNIAENFPLATGGLLSAAQFLQLFLFDPEKQYTYVSRLSGGEKRRLHLLSILFRNPNFLVLDEPTNDLDLPTLGVLENFLSEFQGCLVIVSHDRYFMDKLVDHLFVFEGDGMIRDFPGNYSQYRLWKKDQEQSAVSSQQSAVGSRQSTPDIYRDDSQQLAVDRKQSGVISKKRQLSFKEKREFELLEKQIADLTKEKKAITEKLNSGNTHFDELKQLSHRVGEVTRLLDEKELRWLELSEIL